ncbi:MAG: helix-turn-helix transcriptional regulator [Kiritimatiellae bacterium]|nr:helix-turn-helix transcriptional regulator [Kiritimatiellia bacterium]
MSVVPPVATEIREFALTTFGPGDQTWAAHLHPFYQLDVILAGQVNATVERLGTFREGGGDGLLIPPLCRHGYRTTRGFRQAMCKLHVAPRHWALFGRQPRRFRPPRTVRTCLEEVWRACAADHPLAQEQVLAVVTLCLAQLARTCVPAPRRADGTDPFRERLWPLLEKVGRAPCSGWTVAALAESSGLSVDHFARRFRATLRMTPQRYLKEARMRAVAAALLAQPVKPIKQIAETAGYATVHAFTRAFTREFGISPAAFRRAPGEL